ncbi:MAG TPA: hydroxyacid dehydrogenase [Candidatus Limnocylindrales bacterium]|nr:hydroxyacid dehydrogenase [Candidatus Limnocylindrales bacterium]
MRVLVAEKIAAGGVERLRAAGHVVDERYGLDHAGLVEAVGGYDGLIVRSQLQVDAEVISAGRSLKAVGRAGVGLDNIDVEAARAAGIAVMNAPDGNTIAAAEHTLALLLAVARRIPTADASTRAGEWARSRFGGIELRGRTLGIVGLGRIGLAVADRAAAFGMRRLGFDPYADADRATARGIELVGLPELLERSDVVTVHVPLTPETSNLVDAAAIGRLRRGAIVLNVARGGIVDEAALANALREGRLWGAGVDVFEHEPPTGSPLLDAPNVVLTPHVAASTAEAQVAVGIEIADRLIAALDGAAAEPGSVAAAPGAAATTASPTR